MPVGRSGGIDRRVELVAAGGAERRLVTRCDLDLVEERHLALAATRSEDRDQRRRLGLKPAERPVGLDEGLAAGRGMLAGELRALLGGERCGLGGLDGSLGRSGVGAERCDPLRCCRAGVETGEFRFDLGAFVGEAGDAALGLAKRALGLGALGSDLRQPAGQLGEGFLAVGERRLGGLSALGRLGLALGHLGVGGMDAGLFLVEAGEDGAVVLDHPLFAGDVVAELGEAAVEVGEAFADARLLGVQRLAGMDEPLQRGAGARGGIAKVGEGGGGGRLLLPGMGLSRGALFGNRGGFAERGLGFAERLGRRQPAEVEHRRLGLADLAGEVAVADGLARLALQRLELRLDLADHVVEAGEVLLGGGQPKLGLVAAVVQAGDAGRLFEQRAAVAGLGGDQLADLALTDHRRGMRAARGVGEEELNVAGADVAAVDPVDRPGLALDAARDLEEVGVVQRRRRGAVGIVDDEGDLGGVPRRAVAAAGEDHVVHAGRAHVAVGRFAHHPAKRLDEIRFAAAVRADHSGQPGFDQELGRLDEGLEAENPKPCEFQRPALLALKAGPWKWSVRPWTG